MCLRCSSVAAWARGTAWVRAWKVCKVRATRATTYSYNLLFNVSKASPRATRTANGRRCGPLRLAVPGSQSASAHAAGVTFRTPPHKLPQMRHGIPVVGSYIERRVHGTSGPSLGFVDQCRHGLIRSHTGMSRPPVSLAVAGKFPTLTRGEQRRGGPFPDAIGVDIVGDGCD